MKSGDEYLETQREGPFSISFGQHGGTQWEQDENGAVTIVSGFHASDDPFNAALAKPENVADSPIRVLGVTSAQPACVVVEVRPQHDLVQRRYYDAKSFLLRRIETTDYTGNTTVYRLRRLPHGLWANVSAGDCVPRRPSGKRLADGRAVVRAHLAVVVRGERSSKQAALRYRRPQPRGDPRGVHRTRHHRATHDRRTRFGLRTGLRRFVHGARCGRRAAVGTNGVGHSQSVLRRRLLARQNAGRRFGHRRSARAQRHDRSDPVQRTRGRT